MDGEAKNTLGEVVATVPSGGEGTVADSAISVNGQSHSNLPANNSLKLVVNNESGVETGIILENGVIEVPNPPPPPPVITIENSIYFDGVNDYAIGSPLIDVASDWSVSFWFKLHRLTGSEYFFSFHTDNYGLQSFGIGYRNGQIDFLSWPSEWSFARSFAWNGDLNWHNITATYNKANTMLTTYLDGTNEYSDENYLVSQAFNQMIIGRGAEKNWYANTKIADLKLYAQTLTPANVASIQTAGNTTGTEVQHFAMMEAEGQTSGYIEDHVGGQILRFNNILTPYGIVNDAP